MSKKALGKGLSSIFKELGSPLLDDETGSSVHMIPVHEIQSNPFQPRKDFDGEEIAQLSQSISEKGLLQPIVLRKHKDSFQIIAGERRWRAYKHLGLNTIQAHVRAKVSDRDMMELSLIENIQRVQLSPIEEAMAFRNLSTKLGLTHEEISNKLGKSRSAISNTLRLLTLHSKVQQYLNEGKLSFGHGKALLSLPLQDQVAASERIISEKLNVRQTEKLPPARVQSNKEDPNLKHYIDQLKYFLDAKVSVKGTESKGKIILEYQSRDHLQKIFRLIEKGSNLSK